MKQTIVTALLILVAGASAGFVANAAWYKQPWVKPPKKVSVEPIIDEPANPKGEVKSIAPSQNGDGNGEAAAASSSDSPANPQVGVAASKPPVQTNPCEIDPDKPNVVGMACVLHFLNSGGAYIIDAREEHDFQEGHLKGAILVPSSAIFATIPEKVMGAGISTVDRIIVYCGGGECEASHNVADALRDQFGYEKVYVYEKGWEEIVASGQFGGFIEAGGSN